MCKASCHNDRFDGRFAPWIEVSNTPVTLQFRSRTENRIGKTMYRLQETDDDVPLELKDAKEQEPGDDVTERIVTAPWDFVGPLQ